MEEKQVNISAVAQEKYIPSTLERKRGLLMYFLIGIIISSWKSWLTEFEQYHLKQALWFWLIIIIWILLVSVVRIIPWSRLFLLPISIILLLYLIVFIQQCVTGTRRQVDSLNKKMFYGLWNRVSTLFES